MRANEETVHFSRRAFTLIELLIVVAIIAILALIAVPNFLEAQARAKVSRCMNDMRTLHLGINAYQVDWNDVLRDHNDHDSPWWITSWSTEHPGETPDMEINVSEGHYTIAQWRPLTTPVAYLTTALIQGVSKNVPYGQDTRGHDPGSGIYYCIVYWVILCGGIDRDNGDWLRGTALGHYWARPYDPTNGTVSDGDLWRGEQVVQSRHWKEEYGPWPMSTF